MGNDNSKISHLIPLRSFPISLLCSWTPDPRQWSFSLRFPIQTHYPLDVTFWSKSSLHPLPVSCHLPGLCCLMTPPSQDCLPPRVWKSGLSTRSGTEMTLAPPAWFPSISVQIPADISFCFGTAWVRPAKYELQNLHQNVFTVTITPVFFIRFLWARSITHTLKTC